ncbi:MAG TPA: radical SAM protein [Candidatus Aquilonibacter sp.]|nr:radical SAM protein [Candidatus Aquilonibacter sp.]
MATTPTTRAIKNPKTRFNWRVSDVVRWMKSRWLELKAKITGRKYDCIALAGESEYNLTINSDLTVSCNCQDYDGTGHLGDLRKNSFEEIFFGPTSQKFRDDLAKGKMPIPTCSRCGDLRRLRRGEQPPKPHLPHRGMLLENTVICNVDCIGCAREGAANVRTKKTMPLAELSQMADLAARLKMERIFYLNLGEPFLSPTICQELPLLRQKNPDAYIRVSTNGILLNTDAKRKAALNLSDIQFSVHGISDAMCAKYMMRGSFAKAFDAMKQMAAYRDARGLKMPFLEWKYLLFNWNDSPKTIARAIEMAREISVDIISFWPTHNPFYGMSWRYHLGLLNNVGVKTWKGREVFLRVKQGEAK